MFLLFFRFAALFKFCRCHRRVALFTLLLSLLLLFFFRRMMLVSFLFACAALPPQQSSCKPAWATTALLLLLRQMRRGRGVFSSALTARLRCVLFCLSRSCDCIYFDFSCCCCCFFILFIHNLESDSPNAHLWTAATNQLLRCDSGQRGGGVDCAASASRHLLRLCVRVCVSHSHLSFVLI